MSTDQERFEALEARYKALADEKAYLQLVNYMLSRMSETRNLDALVTTVLQVIAETIGCTMVSLTYFVEDQAFFEDVLGNKASLASIEDPEVREAIASGTPLERDKPFVESQLETAEFTKTADWLYPLNVDAEVLGVIKIENTHIRMRGITKYLPLFFGYVALDLKNKVLGHSHLQDLNQRLEREISVRRQTEEHLKASKEELEQKVALRTADISRNNLRLNLELQERQRVTLNLRKSNRSFQTLAACSQLVVTMDDEQALVHEACRILVELGGYPCVWITIPGSEKPLVQTARQLLGSNKVLLETETVWGQRLAQFTAETMRSGIPMFSIDVSKDLRFADWHTELQQQGFASFAVFPMRVGDKEEGALHLLSGKPDAFNEEEKSLLMQIGGNLASGVSRIRNARNLTKALREKDVLLQELYHRSRNNMQVICSLLDLQASSTDDFQVAETYRTMGSRIRTMALVYQKLYQSRDLSHIAMGEYMSDLVRLLGLSHGESGRKVSITSEAEGIGMLIDTAVPCGLLVTEFVTNALQHAFLGRSEGQVMVKLRHLGERSIELSVQDDGVGLAAGFDPRQKARTGLTVAYGIAEHQLQGSMVHDLVQGGLRWTVIFRDTLYQARV